MSLHDWGWLLRDFVNAPRPFLVTLKHDWIAYPASVTDDLTQVSAEAISACMAANIEPEYLLLQVAGIPSQEFFETAWQFSIRNKRIVIAWCDVATQLRWDNLTTAVIEEHHPEGVKGMIDDFLGVNS